MGSRNIITRSAALAMIGISIIGLTACGSTGTAQDDNMESTSIVESEESTTLETEAETEAENGIAQADEWAENIYQLLIAEDYDTLLPILADYETVTENVAGYEYEDVQYEGAYAFTAADGTVFGIIIEGDSSSWCVNAFVSDDTRYGFLVISVGNSHYAWIRSTGAYAYLKDKIYYVYDSDGSQEVYEWEDDAGIVIWQ